MEKHDKVGKTEDGKFSCEAWILWQALVIEKIQVEQRPVLQNLTQSLFPFSICLFINLNKFYN